MQVKGGSHCPVEVMLCVTSDTNNLKKEYENLAQRNQEIAALIAMSAVNLRKK